jgi:hypothetical protein
LKMFATRILLKNPFKLKNSLNGFLKKSYFILKIMLTQQPQKILTVATFDIFVSFTF